MNDKNKWWPTSQILGYKKSGTLSDQTEVSRLTGEEVPVAVGFILALLAVGHGRHLLGGGAAHLLLLSCSPPHS